MKYITEEQLAKVQNTASTDPHGCARLIREVMKEAMIKEFDLDYTNPIDRITIDRAILESVIEWREEFKKQLTY